MNPRIRRILLSLLTLLLAAVVGLAIQVDNWSRDLTTNFATTDPMTSDPMLQPLELPISATALVEALQVFADSTPRWELVSTDEKKVRLTRTTWLMRFVDDVEVTLEPKDSGITVNISSQSRVGKGDLGQNPRNIRELRRCLKQRFTVQ